MNQSHEAHHSARPLHSPKGPHSRLSFVFLEAARFELPALESGTDQRTAMELAARPGSDIAPLVDRALMAIYRRQQELAWTEHLVQDIETALEQAGVLGRPERVPAMCSWTWWATPG
jgi:hypothetical protein